MPKYTFVCECGSSLQKMVYASIKSLKCEECGKDMSRKLPVLSGSPTVNETIDSYTGTVQPANQRDMVEQRRDEYYWTVEVPRLVDSGTYELQTMIEMGWVTVDDKGQLHVNNKPPHKR